MRARLINLGDNSPDPSSALTVNRVITSVEWQKWWRLVDGLACANRLRLRFRRPEYWVNPLSAFWR
jgi:hypothetical protein